MKTLPEAITERIMGHQYRYGSELDIQDSIAKVLIGSGCLVTREVRLDSRNRIDLMFADIGIEVKIKGSRASVLHQLERYAEFDEIATLILVSTKTNHQPPTELNGKPVYFAWIGGTL